MKKKIEELKKHNCYYCKRAEEIPGNCHIRCTKPLKQEEIGAGGNERWIEADKIVKERKVVVRCIWSGCGSYPLCFDGNTVFACSNFKKQEGK